MKLRIAQFSILVTFLLLLFEGYAQQCNVTVTTQPTISICEGNTLTIISNVTGAGSNNVTYQWIDPSGTAISGATSSTLSLSNIQTNQAGNYIVQISNQNCTNPISSDTTLVVVNIPFSIFAGSDIGACVGSPINLTSTITGSPVGTVTYSWTGPNGFTSSQQNPTISNPGTSAGGTYTVTATAGGCGDSDGVSVVMVNPTISSGQLQSFSGNLWLVECTQPGFPNGDIFVTNGISSSVYNLVNNYSINWGDGSPNYSTTDDINTYCNDKFWMYNKRNF
jgi:hypothetical protein